MKFIYVFNIYLLFFNNNIYLLFFKYVKEHIIHKNNIYNICSAQGTDPNLVYLYI